jgi:mono/diheme cytochrome c family protein
MRVLASLIAGAMALLAHPAHAGPPPRKTPELLEIGRVSFKLNCASCHGPRGEGDGVSAASLDPRPRNFVTEPLEHGATVARIFRTLEEGVAGTAMIAFTFLPEEERWALAYYVLELRARGKAAGKGSTK